MMDNNKQSPEAYPNFVAEVVNLVQHHRVQAIQTVQAISNNLYWNIGELIIKKQQAFGLGKSIVEQLSKDLTQKIGDGVSWSPRNLWLMMQLVSEYSILNQLGSELESITKKQNVKQPASLLPNLYQARSDFEMVKQLVAEVPWKHNIVILQKVKDHQARLFYLQTTIKNR